ncbi:MAG: DUF6114 domain-containing protein [Natrialbaceae archaeon]|nr:DUF6114 domain-containing protein [Natrialbaceae archaeon]
MSEEPTVSRRQQFAEWRRSRPFWGGVIMMLAGFVIGYIPVNLAMSIGLIPTDFGMMGLLFAIFVVLCGLFAVIQPNLATFFGSAGILLSITSIFGALGGFGIGTLLGILGGSLIIAWEPADVTEEDEVSERRSLRSRLSTPEFLSR